jgi:hypothetical protein
MNFHWLIQQAGGDARAGGCPYSLFEQPVSIANSFSTGKTFLITLPGGVKTMQVAHAHVKAAASLCFGLAHIFFNPGGGNAVQL